MVSSSSTDRSFNVILPGGLTASYSYVEGNDEEGSYLLVEQPKVDAAALQAWIDKNTIDSLVNIVINNCPTRAILFEKGTMVIDNKNCIHCMHCINVIPQALSPGKERGVTLLLGGKNVLKVGVMGGTMIVPFLRMETDEDVDNFIQLSETMIEWWNDNGFDHERIGETIERVGLKQFLDGVGLEASIDMVTQPRNNPYYKSEY